MKQIKTTASTRDLATSEYGYLILLALFDSVDDTVLVKKVKTEIFDSLEIIILKLISNICVMYDYFMVSDNYS